MKLATASLELVRMVKEAATTNEMTISNINDERLNETKDSARWCKHIDSPLTPI